MQFPACLRVVEVLQPFHPVAAELHLHQLTDRQGLRPSVAVHGDFGEAELQGVRSLRPVMLVGGLPAWLTVHVEFHPPDVAASLLYKLPVPRCRMMFPPVNIHRAHETNQIFSELPHSLPVLPFSCLSRNAILVSPSRFGYMPLRSTGRFAGIAPAPHAALSLTDAVGGHPPCPKNSIPAPPITPHLQNTFGIPQEVRRLQ